MSEERNLSARCIVQELGSEIAWRIQREVINEMRRMKETLTEGTAYGLQTVWDEYCVQVQVRPAMNRKLSG